MDFVSLHTHSTFSYQDGFGMPVEHAYRVAELGMSAFALTEHGNVSSLVKGSQAARVAGLKFIPGLEGYIGPANMRETKNRRKWHQTILAADQVGYANLMKMVARSWEEGFYQWPTISPAMLTEHSEGLIVTSGCADSRLACALLGGKGAESGSVEAAERLLKRYLHVFGDRFYLETQRFPRLERTCALNQQYAQWARKYGVRLVATADVHYPDPGDNEMQKILHAAGRNTGSVAAAEAEWEYDILLTYPTSDEQIYHDLIATGLDWNEANMAISASAEIAERCNVEIPVMAPVVYPYAADAATSEEQLIRRWMTEGWQRRGIDRLDRATRTRYHDRAQRELDILASKGFLSYILMIADAVRWAKHQQIAVGPGRGSAAGSLVLYLLQVTEIDPMRYPLMMFERFVDLDRSDLPDVDIDFEPSRRDEVRLYLVEKYGADKVGNVGTFTYYRAKNSVDDVARVHQVPFLTAKKVKEMVMDEGLGVTLDTLPVVAKIFDEFPALHFARRLEGNIKGFGIHAAGLVIGAEPLTDYVTYYTKDVGTGTRKKNVSVMSVDKYDGEQLGLLKIDALGLTTMGMIHTAAECVGMSMDDVYAIDLADPKTMAEFRQGHVGGIFQFEGTTTHNILVEVQPTEVMDLSHINALSRPGPLHGGSTSDFIKARQGLKQRERYADVVEDILAMTEGEIVYQEQVIALAAQVGGFTTVEAARVRKIISKKLGQAAFAELWERFEAGAAARGVPVEQAGAVWRKMVTSGAYSFNVAHSVSYAVLAFWCMWFRVHHPQAFFYARLRSVDDGSDSAAKTLEVLKDMKANSNIELLPLDPEFSDVSWSMGAPSAVSSWTSKALKRPPRPALRPGLTQIKGIGHSVGAKMVAARSAPIQPEGGWSWTDYSVVDGVGPKTIEKISEFAGSKDPFGVEWLSDRTIDIKGWLNSREMQIERMPMPNASSVDVPYMEGEWSGTLLGVLLEVQYRDLFETHRNRTGTDLDPADVKDPHLARSCSLFCEDVRGRFKVNVGRFQFPRYAAEIEGAVTGQDFVLAMVRKGSFPGKTTFADRLWVISPDD